MTDSPEDVPLDFMPGLVPAIHVFVAAKQDARSDAI
jgi:hypothetical protein